MTRFALWRKIIATTLANLLFVQLFAGTAYALGEGPAQPEATQFEPVDTTDLVNLGTGDLAYNLPVLEVPGAEGSYPMSLSYHSGVSTNQEATWVGLGWSLNPGAINRMVSGYPDDYRADKVETHYWAKTKHGWGANIAVGFGPVGLGLDYDNHAGLNGSVLLGFSSPMVRAQASIGTKGWNMSASVGNRYVGPNFGIDAGSQGASANISVATGNGSPEGNQNNPQRIGIGIGSKGVSLRLGGFDISSQGVKATFSNGSSMSISSMSTSNGGKISSVGFGTGRVYLGKGFWAELGIMAHRIRLNETFVEDGYGFLYQSDYYADSDDDKKFERHVQDKYLYSSQDLYIVAAQGMDGTFMPFVDEPFLLWDGGKSENKSQLRNEYVLYNPVTQENELVFGPYGQNGNIRWRFLGDEGSNCIMLGTGWSNSYSAMSGMPHGSKRIVPVTNAATGKITGFHITDMDGKVYEFMQPVYNVYQYSKTIDRVGTSDKTKYETYNIMGSPYATSWYLTSIKGPDYVDRGPSGCDPGDWGYWVKFNYEKSGNLQLWRSPFRGFGPGTSSDDMENFSLGFREVVYLVSVETNTHVALFRTSTAPDRIGTDDVSEIELHASKKELGSPLRIRFLGNWVQAIDSFSGDSLVYLKMRGFSHWYDASLRREIYNSLDRKFYLDKSDFASWSYDSSTNETEIVVTGNFQSWTSQQHTYVVQNSKAIRSAVLFANKLTSTRTQLAKRLDRIDLYMKNTPGITNSGGVWITQGNAASIRSVEFGYGYQLCPGTPSSTNGGKAALRQVKFVGKEGASYMPSYQFTYGFNPSYNEHDWDAWGSYKDPGVGGSDRGLYKHQTPQDKIRADRAAAWHLSNVLTPTGGNISIEYESDDFFSVGDFVDVDQFKTFSTITKVSGSNVSFTSSDPNVLSLNLKAGNWVCVKTEYGQEPYCGAIYKKYAVRKINSVSQTTGSVTVTMDNSVDWTPANSCNQSYSAAYYPQKIYGGGVRVKSIASTDGANTYKTVYSYEDNNGFSTGVTATLPPLYKDFPEWIDDDLDKDQKEKYEKILMDHDYAYGAPSPGVIYSKVSMWNVDASGNPINGKTEFEFMTAKDHQFTATHTDGNYNLDQLKINDKSGIYGRPKATRQYELTPNGQFRLVAENLQAYDFSSSLSARTRVVKDGNVTVPTASQPLGMISEKYMFRNKYDDDKIKIRYMTKEFENVYLYETQARSYFYNDDVSLTPSGSMNVVNRNFLRDALTGQILGSAVYNTRGYADVTRVEPAYWRYTGMKDKNMLTPIALEATYKSNISLFALPSELRDYSFSSDDLLAATATTWSNQFDVNGDGQAETGMWRQNDTWTYNKQIDRAGGSAYSDFANWNYTGTNYPNVDANQPWKMTSNITRYDAYAHPVEEIGIDGNYTAAIFGYESALPIAIAQNSKLSDLRYYNFEKTATPEFKTGQGSGAYASGQAVRDENNTIITAPAGTGPYRVTAWVKPTGESQWQYFEATLSTGQQLIVSGTSGLIDDIRIQPKGSTMSTFTYDPLTWKVTAIMDANNIATYYEYDTGGRLVKVYDQDRNMIKKYAYQYKRTN